MSWSLDAAVVHWMCVYLNIIKAATAMVTNAAMELEEETVDLNQSIHL